MVDSAPNLAKQKGHPGFTPGGLFTSLPEGTRVPRGWLLNAIDAERFRPWAETGGIEF